MAFASMEGQKLEVIVRKEKKRRSNPQNAYYHAVVVPLVAEATGYTKAEAHEALKVHFLSDMSGPLPLVKSTTDLTTSEFCDFIANIQEFSAENLGITIPDPNQVDWV